MYNPISNSIGAYGICFVVIVWFFFDFLSKELYTSDILPVLKHWGFLGFILEVFTFQTPFTVSTFIASNPELLRGLI